jgi:hypothetical protein
MLYTSANEWRSAPAKRVLLFGMSGLGKTHVSNMLRRSGGWFHYSVDYRIGTRYMGEHIVDNFKREAMKTPFLANLLRSDSIYIASNITFNNLSPLSTYLGKPGDPTKGGLPFAEYMRRQNLHREAEISSLLDTHRFASRAKDLYGYDNFVCDSGGSICEVVDPDDPNDPVLGALAQDHLMVWIKGDEAHTSELLRRFDADPKPMYYHPEILHRLWSTYLEKMGIAEDAVDPDAFIRWAYGEALAHRAPRYEKMAENWGVSVAANDIAGLEDVAAFSDMICDALGKSSETP